MLPYLRITNAYTMENRDGILQKIVRKNCISGKTAKNQLKAKSFVSFVSFLKYEKINFSERSFFFFFQSIFWPIYDTHRIFLKSIFDVFKRSHNAGNLLSPEKDVFFSIFVTFSRQKQTCSPIIFFQNPNEVIQPFL